jgi:hypothetical protein
MAQGYQRETLSANSAIGGSEVMVLRLSNVVENKHGQRLFKLPQKFCLGNICLCQQCSFFLRCQTDLILDLK